MSLINNKSYTVKQQLRVSKNKSTNLSIENRTYENYYKRVRVRAISDY